MKLPRPSLTFSILASLACLLILTWLLFSLLAFKTAENDLYSQKNEHARLLLATFVNQLPDFDDLLSEGQLPVDSPAAIYAARLSQEPDFERLTLKNRDGELMFTVGRPAGNPNLPFMLLTSESIASGISSDGNFLIRQTGLAENNQNLGQAGLVLSLIDEQLRIKRTRQLLVYYFVLDFILLLGLGSFALSRIVVAPVNRLLAATEKITGGVYGHQLKVSGANELAGLARSFNQMSSTLAQKQQELDSNLTALKQTNQELQLAREEAIRTEKMASVGLLAAGTAHEIGTPLAAVIGYAEILAQELEQNQTHADYLNRMLESCNRIDRIVKGLLEYARPKQADHVKVLLPELVRQTLELMQHQGFFKGIDCSFEQHDSSETLMIDPHQLQQVLINLLINASDAMPDGGKLSLKISSSEDGKMQILEICDTGAGIKPEDLGRIFDPFFTTKAPGKGTGLGLALSARIIDGFNGRISVKSRPGQGSCFRIYLPCNG